MNTKYIMFGLIVSGLLTLAALLLSQKDSSVVVIDIVGEALPPLESLKELAKQYTEETGVRVRIHPFEFETALQRAQLDLGNI